jgi:hypothetical protein
MLWRGTPLRQVVEARRPLFYSGGCQPRRAARVGIPRQVPGLVVPAGLWLLGWCWRRLQGRWGPPWCLWMVDTDAILGIGCSSARVVSALAPLVALEGFPWGG